MSDSTLRSIENQLLSLLTVDRHNWTQIYQLMQQVEDEQLYSGAGYKSFTAWVNELAVKSKVHVSILWQRKKAGKFYSEYRKNAEERGIFVPSIDEIKVSSDDLSLVEKISGGSEKVQDTLISKVINRELSRKDLKDAWAIEKAARESRGQIITRKSRHDDLLRMPVADKNKMDAYVILSVLSLNKNWLPRAEFTEKYRLFPEFTVRTGSSRHGRRMDALIASVDDTGLNLIGIEIKVELSDLLNDHKMAEYTDFVDQFYLAIPDDPEMIKAAESYCLKEWGIITIDNEKNIKVISAASPMVAVMRTDTLISLVYKTL